MKVFRWDNEKNEWLKNNRGVSFEQVVILMEREIFSKPLSIRIKPGIQDRRSQRF